MTGEVPDYAELMPCSLNAFQEKTGLQEPELIPSFTAALNTFRLAVQAEREKRGQLS